MVEDTRKGGLNGINQIYFSNYKKMETYHYSQDYLKIRGNIRHSWKVHKKIMSELDLPYVDYRAFNQRVTKLNWNLYRAIHTPSKVKMRRTKKWSKLKKFFRSLFK